MLEALDFPSRGYRENTVENAHGRTCEWLLENKQYRAWVASRTSDAPKHRLLWIKGKAGSGKSTIMKFALKNSRRKPEPSETTREGRIGFAGPTFTFFREIFGAQQRQEQEKPRDLIFSHFFNARAKEQLDKSAEGMYRTLLVQILKRIPRLQEIFAHLQEDWMPSKGLPWPVPKLEELLNTAVENLGGRPIAFYVDALDECDKHEIRQMIQVFANIIKKAASSQQTVRVCFASRPYTDYTTRGAIYLDLSIVQEHKRDIAAYVDSYLQIGDDSTARKARRRLLHMAQGVFLWVKLVVEKLNDEHGAGRPDLYTRWLRGAHGELRLLYKDMLERGMSDGDKEIDERKKLAAIACFQVALFRADNISPRALVYAIEQVLEGDDKTRAPRWKSMDEDTIRRYISSASQGLIECTHAGFHESIQFIHESAQDFMLSKHGLERLLEPETMADIDLRCHEVLRTVCDRALSNALLDQSQLAGFLEWEALVAKLRKDRSLGVNVKSEPNDTDPKQFLEEHPMLMYARRYILTHADAVQRHNGNQKNQGLWLSQLYETHGHSMMNRMWQSFHHYIVSSMYLVDFMVMRQLDALMRASKPLLLRDIRQGRQWHRAPGIWLGTGTGRRWTYVGLRTMWGAKRREESTARCLVDLYLEHLESTARPGSMQAVLRQLADSWSLERGVPSDWDDHSGITLADVSDKLALFFLIALIPANAINDSVVEAIMSHVSAGFAETLLVVLDRSIPTDFLVLDDPMVSPSYLYWAEDNQYSALVASLRSCGIRRISEDSEKQAAWGQPGVSWRSSGSSDLQSESPVSSQSIHDSSDG